MARVVSPAGEETAAWTPSTLPSRTGKLQLIRATASVVTSVAVLTAAWWFLAPPQLGGSTSFTTVDGTSMLPSLERSDLVALRPAGSYRVGDVAGYRSMLLGRVVLHRIVAIHDGRYVFKGDNNSFRDPDHPTRAQLVGKVWFELPMAGHAVEALHVPWVVAVIAALLVLALGMGGRQTGPREADGRRGGRTEAGTGSRSSSS